MQDWKMTDKIAGLKMQDRKMTCIFNSCDFVRHFPFLHFPVLHFQPPPHQECKMRGASRRKPCQWMHVHADYVSVTSTLYSDMTVSYTHLTLPTIYSV